MDTITPALILALSLLATVLVLALFVWIGMVRSILLRSEQSQKMAMDNLDKMARKVLSLSDKPPAHQLAAIEAARMIRGDDTPATTDEYQMQSG